MNLGGMKETEADIKVKSDLWGATVREITRFGKSYSTYSNGKRARTDDQEELLSTAKVRGYPKGVVEDVGRKILKGEPPESSSKLADYRVKIGLH